MGGKTDGEKRMVEKLKVFDLVEVANTMGRMLG